MKPNHKLIKMKKFILLLLVILTSINLNAQTPTWVCLNVSVESEGQEKFIESLDNLMESVDDFPYTVTLFETQFGNSDVNFSHQLCFLGESAEDFAQWGVGGNPPTVEGVVFFNTFQDFVEVEQIVLGQPMIFDPSNLESDFQAVFAINVTDVQKFGSAFGKMMNSIDFDEGSFELHDAVLGAEEGVTHYWVVRANNLADFLEGRSEFINSGAAGQFVGDASGSFEFVFGFGSRTIKNYN